MATIGRSNQLKVVKEVKFGVYLDGEELGDILLPVRYVSENTKIGDVLDVFIYLDSDDYLIATTLEPKTSVGEFACLTAVSVNRIGAFFDWGLPKICWCRSASRSSPSKKVKIHCVYLSG
ncbi:S1-like domain-containing RNA-binding protein [Aliamphritea spongicola]|nr:S1-like domain-containing RNA-binding protein [Aliamphritea spongicola]